MRHITRIALAVISLLLALPGATRADESRLPPAMLDQTDLRIQRVETACNTYVLLCKKTKEYVVVDPGFGMPALVAAYAKTGHVLRGVWVTHEHLDHVAGLGALAERKTVPIVAHGDTKNSIEKVRANWNSRGMARRAPTPPTTPTTLVADGDRVTLGALTWTVLHLPGHSPGSVGYLLPGRVLVAGDVLFKGSVGRTDLPTGDRTAFQRSLGTLWDLPDEVVVLPGHGSPTTIETEKTSNRLFQDFARPWLGLDFARDHAGPGLRIGAVVEDSPATRAGLRVGDLLLEADGKALGTPRDLASVTHRHGVGDEVPLVIRRGTERKGLTLRFGARPLR